MTTTSLVRRRRRRRLLVLLGTVVLCCAAGAWGVWHWYATRPPEPPVVNLDGAEPRVAQAIREAAATVRAKPTSAAAWGRLGLILGAHAYDDEGDVCFAQAERLDPNDPRWPYLQGIHRRPHEPDAALTFLTRAADLCDRSAPALTAPRLQLAEMLLERGRPADAEAELRKVLDRDPANARANFDLGLVALARDDLAATLRYLTPLADNREARQKVANQLALIYARQDDPTNAARFVRRAAELPLDQGWPDPYLEEFDQFDVGRVARFRRAAEVPGAQARSTERLKTFAGLADEYSDGEARGALAMVLLNEGQVAAAEIAFRDTVARAPNKPAAHYYLGNILFAQGETARKQGDSDQARAKYREAVECADRAVKLKPDHGLAHLLRGMALRQLGERGEALTALRRAAFCRPEVAEVHELLGETLADSGADWEALAELQTALELSQKEPQLREKTAAQYARVLLRAFLPVFP